MKTNFELKGLIDVIINRFLEIMNIRPFKPKVDDFLRTEYNNSIEKVETELKPNINLVPNADNLNFLNDYAFQNLQGNADQIGNKLRQEVQRGILNNETPAELKQRIKDLFKDINYSSQLKTVMRTEKLRANNMGAYDGALQAQESGIKLKKFVHVTEDKRTSPICHKEHAQYGTKEEAIPLNEEFIVKVDNKTYRAQYPPFHPNCRTVIRFTREDN